MCTKFNIEKLVLKFGEENRKLIEEAVHLAHIFKVDLEKLVTNLIELENKSNG